MSRSDVTQAIGSLVTRLTGSNASPGQDTDEEVLKALATLNSISPEETDAIRVEAQKLINNPSPTVSAAARSLNRALQMITSLRARAVTSDEKYKAQGEQQKIDIAARLRAGVQTTTYAGTILPEAVKTVMRDALADGAVTYDVRMLDTDPYVDTEHGEPELSLTGVHSPYPQEQPAVDSMRFENTEVTPQKIAEDMATTRPLTVFDRIVDKVAYATERVMKPETGDIHAAYDEARWSNTMARGPKGERWTNNCSILADGSTHFVPYSRRSMGTPRQIMTNPSLPRGKLSVWNGHVNAEDGVITYIGMSGRIAKKMQRDGVKFVDPIAIFKAWGFEIRPGLTVTLE